MALPISLLWNVRVSTARRLTLAAVFGLAVITMITSILRVILVPKDGPLYPTQVETTWHYLWHIIEFKRVKVQDDGDLGGLTFTDNMSGKRLWLAEELLDDCGL